MQSSNIPTPDTSPKLIPIIAQDVESGIIRMVGVGNEESIAVSDKIGNLTFWSRTKGRLWTKGEESRDFLQIQEKIPLSSSLVGATQTAVIYKVNQIIGKTGMTCHTGSPTCFYRPAMSISELSLDQIDFAKMDGKILVLVQNIASKDVVMAGILNKLEIAQLLGEYRKQSTGLPQFQVDCDNDTMLVLI